MIIQVLSILGICLLAWGYIAEYRQRVRLQRQIKQLGR